MSRRFSACSIVLALLLAGCDRPFVAIDPPGVEIISPDLNVVQSNETITIVLRVTSLRRVTRVEVNGKEASPSTENGVFEFATALSEGTNRLIVDAYDTEGDVGSDTLFSVYLPYTTSNILAGTLPQPLTSHTSVQMTNGSLFVAGGFDGNGTASATAYTYIEQGFDFQIATLPAGLARARAGHTATLLPDGRVLVVGGATDSDPNEAGAFEVTGELYDPNSNGFSTPGFSGAPIRRAFHTATTLSDRGRTFVYLFGGRGIVSGTAVQTRSDVTVLELKSTAIGDSLINISPGGAVGAFPAVAHHIQLPLLNEGGFFRALTAGTYETPDDSNADPVSFRFLYAPSDFFFPFEVFEETLPTMRIARTAHAAALASPELAIIAGGRMADGTTLDNIEVFADEASRFFSFPSSSVLRTARYGHTATLLPSGRILILGGINAVGTTIASAEYILPPFP